jgi:hypothetical protein
VSRPNGVIAWEGPSLFTGRPIRMVLSCLGVKSKNEKTGHMVQVSIVQADANPSLCRGTDRERDVCGDCPAAKRREGWCYAVWMAWILGQRAHTWKRVDVFEAAQLARGAPVRFGAYGDPAAIPFDVWEPLRSVAGRKGWTAYTRAWRICDPRWKAYAMASVHSLEEQREAAAAGWRTFRVRRPNSELAAGEIPCLNEGPAEIQCERCALCRGQASADFPKPREAPHIAITAHGSAARRFKG